MTEGPVIIDTPLLLLLIVGLAERAYIYKHDRLKNYSEDDFDTLVEIIKLHSDIVLVPNILTEVSSFARQIKNPARAKIQRKFKEFVNSNYEIYIPSRAGANRDEFMSLGLTDAVLLHLNAIPLGDMDLTLLSVDVDLINSAHSLGYKVMDFNAWR